MPKKFKINPIYAAGGLVVGAVGLGVLILPSPEEPYPESCNTVYRAVFERLHDGGEGFVKADASNLSYTCSINHAGVIRGRYQIGQANSVLFRADPDNPVDTLETTIDGVRWRKF